MLCNKFIIVPISKAGSNFAFICQRHYAQVLINELCLNAVKNIALTYMKSSKPVEKLVSNKKNFLKSKI